MQTQEEKRLIEDFGVHLEQKEELSPLAARIYATLILQVGYGVTFDELVNDLEASKSSISTNLKMLSQLNLIEYTTKCGDRKKYYRVPHDQVYRVIDRKISTWEKELSLHKRVYNYKKSKAEQLNPDFPVDLNFNQLFIQYAQSMIEGLTNIKHKLKENSIEND
ncbi:GbsR/MarR family transcriptional regulator [Salibacter halophilus]|uniref:MarR family transcriptional regulator n=1 Tax=Salibacter halophilus TaxID=1803916 RepID=A0A6N6M9L5_9FLAO|nr:MarR family transcriptional regulator [Salibacter halophilus]KAB1065695.1 MarR family transcriptional regulator [Salibacter halophilus]